MWLSRQGFEAAVLSLESSLGPFEELQKALTPGLPERGPDVIGLKCRPMA